VQAVVISLKEIVWLGVCEYWLNLKDTRLCFEISLLSLIFQELTLNVCSIFSNGFGKEVCSKFRVIVE